jgi:arginase
MATIRLIGVPFDGMGRKPGQAGAPAALRAAGLEAALSSHKVVSQPDLTLPEARAERALESGLLNETALVKMVEALYAELSESFSAGQFPLVYGADCSVLLAAVPALKDALGEPGLVFVDGHEDATPIDRSTDGEAANMEVAILLGLTGELLTDPLGRAVNAIKPETLAMLGPRDQPWRRQRGVETIAGHVLLRNSEEVAADPAGVTRSAIESISSHTSSWWLHTDLDVLSERDFFARGAPGEISLDGGLTWQQLTEVIQTALGAGGCRGWSLAIYNPDLDPDRSQARRIVRLVTEIAPHLPNKFGVPK